MAWNLADEINTDWSSDSLFDDLPTQSKALERDEAIRTADAGGDLNTSAEGSFVTNSKIPTLESPKEKAATDSALGEIQTDLGKNVLETFEAPKKKEAAKETAEEEEYEDEPEEEYLGRTLAAGQLLISNLKYAQDGRIGRNAREFQMEKRLDDQAIAAVRAQMQRNLKGLEYDPGLFDMLATRKGGGRRPAEEITELIRIQKNKGALILNDEGKEAFAPANDWEEVEKVYDLRSAQKMKLVVSGKTAGGGAEEITRWQGVMKNTLDAEGNVMPDRMGEYEKAASEIDRLTGAPTGVSKFANQFNSKQDRISKMTAAMDSGIPYKGLAVEQIPSEILKLNQETVELAVENAPYFGANDREAAAKWVTDPATKGLPFRSDYEGKKIPHFVTSELGVYNIWSPKEKTWMVVDKRKPETATAAEPTDNSQFSEAGKTGQKIRRAAGKLSGVAESGLAKAGVAVADLLPLSVNTGAAVIEGAAGVFDSPLKLDRMDYMEERAKKNKVGKYRVK
jgi:hypothetical protein